MTKTEQYNFYKTLGQRIKSARIKAGLKQEAFANYIGLSRVSVVNIEQGRQHPPLHTLVSIAGVLHTTTTELLPSVYLKEEPKAIWKKIIKEKMKSDKNLDQDKLYSFVKEFQLSKKT